VKEPRRHAPALDSFMSHVHRLGAEQIMFSTWKRASFRLWGDNHWVERPSLIVNQLYGADGMARIQGGKDLNVMYVIGVSRTQTLRFRVNVSGIVTSKGDGANVTIRPVKDLPPPLERQNVEPEILKAYRMKKGLMIVSGATGSGKSTLIGGMTMAKLLDPGAHLNIIECAEPIESAISGHATCTTLHAENVALTMQRVAGLFPPEQMKNLMISASQALRLIINQRLVKDPRDKWTPLREFLVFDAPFRKKLASAHADEWPHITMEAVEKEGQSLLSG
jgi:defect-in-organelle-trafficking protein DotB